MLVVLSCRARFLADKVTEWASPPRDGCRPSFRDAADRWDCGGGGAAAAAAAVHCLCGASPPWLTGGLSGLPLPPLSQLLC